MTSEWKEYKLKDVCIKITDGSHYSPKATELGYPMLSVKDMQEFGFSYTNCKYITEQDFVKMQQNDCVPLENDILVAKDGSYLKHIFICKKNKQEAILSSIALFRPNTKIINPNFLCYLLKSPNIYNYIKLNCVSGSALPRIILKDFKNITIGIPPFETQQKIAKVLSAIDDKIELNNSINNNLEQQAMVLFKEKIIKNCDNNKNGTIGDYCSVKSGYAFKGTWWRDYGVKVIKIKTIDNDSINFNDCSYVSKDKIEFAKDFIVQGGDLLIAMTGATIGKFAVIPKVNEPLLVNQRVGKFFLDSEPLNRLAFLYCSLKQQDIINEIINRGQGSAQPNISSTDIMTTPCYLPNRYIIDEFNELCKPIFETIITNKYENERLTQLRDTLLPKLMSGEIDVSNVEIDEIFESSSTDKLSFSEDK